MPNHSKPGEGEEGGDLGRVVVLVKEIEDGEPE
jgi:hypothetical protein